MLPLEGVRVVEFAHMVMGPSCGLVLADLGAEVIKVEPLAGDNTRRLEHAGSGFYPVFNRNKKSLAIDLQHPEGRQSRSPPALTRLELGPWVSLQHHPRHVAAWRGGQPGVGELAKAVA